MRSESRSPTPVSAKATSTWEESFGLTISSTRWSQDTSKLTKAGPFPLLLLLSPTLPLLSAEAICAHLLLLSSHILVSFIRGRSNLHSPDVTVTTPPIGAPPNRVIGRITMLGKNVKDHKIGDLVGCCPQRSYCNNCEYCKKELTNLCPDQKGLYNPYFGGYATHIQLPGSMAFPSKA